MTERNLIKEGFVSNTLTESLTLSGTEFVSSLDINGLVNEDFITTAITITGTNTIALEADLGARWKLKRIEYYTDDALVNDIQILISDNKLDFFTVTMTGSPPKYVGDILDSTVSGSPRFIRLTHSGTGDVTVQEWRAINDDTFVDFGINGDLNQITINDAPIGKPSDSVQTLVLFNKFNKPATGSVFIDNTFTEADDEIQISTSATGPFFGRTTSPNKQPNITRWQFGEITTAQIVSSGSYKTDFINNNLKGWSTTGISSGTLSNRVFTGITNNFSPAFQILNDFTLEGSSSIIPLADVSNFFVFPSQDFNRVRVKLRIPTIDRTLITEGPRLFWRNQEIESSGFDINKSILSTTLSPVFSNTIQDYIFNVDNTPTWSGTIRGFKIQPFIVTSGINFPLELHELEVFHSSLQERVRLAFTPVNSGTFPNFNMGFNKSIVDHTIIMLRTVITKPCIITNLRILRSPQTTTGIFLVTISGNSDKTVGSNWVVKRNVELPAVRSNFTSSSRFQESKVFWPAEPGDYIGFSHPFTSDEVPYLDSDPQDALASSSTATFASLAITQQSLDTTTFSFQARNYFISYDAIQTDEYFPTGKYRTPIFDGGVSPALLSIDFNANIPNGTSIDSGGASFNTLIARASEIPPRTIPMLGTTVGPLRLFNDFPSVNVPSDFAINTLNGPVTNRENVSSATPPHNAAGTILFHELKQELWVLNVLASGTLLDLRPIWDAFTIDGQYLRTQNVTGAINYAYNDTTSASNFGFEPVGFIADYIKEEIYIIQRNPSFTVGAGTYYGIILDLEGNFKEVFMRAGNINEPTSIRFTSMQEITYDGNFFFILTSDAATSTNRKLLMVLRNGTSTFSRDIKFINEVQIDSIPGLENSSLIVSPFGPKGIAFNSVNQLLYLYFEAFFPGTGGLDSLDPKLFAIKATPDDPDTDFATNITFALTTTSGTANNSIVARDGFSFEVATTIDESPIVRNRQLTPTTNMIYIISRDTFILLQNRRALFASNFFAPGIQQLNFSLFDGSAMSFFIEIAANSFNNSNFFLPDVSVASDPIWGTISGSLPFETIATDSILFPTGRFAQVEFTLNSTQDRTKSPFLLSSQITQGISVGEIVASGTKNIFLRTDIPQDKSISDQKGRLKVFWQMEE